MECKQISLALAAATVVGFTACQEEDFGYTAKEINYTTEFVKAYGMPNVNHDWSTISTRTVSVTMPEEGAYTVMVTNHCLDYKQDDVILFARYEGVSSNGEALPVRFDYPKGYDRVYVTLKDDVNNRIATRQVTMEDGEGEVEFTPAMLLANAPVSYPEPKKSEYLIAFEDLGGTCDWDFNDVVIGVSHPTGADLVITVKAVGGILPATISYNGQDVLFNGESDLHEAFGVDSDIRVNVGADSNLGDVFETKECLSATIALSDKSATMSQLLANLSLSVNGTTNIAAPCDNSSVTSPSNTPQAILIADANWSCPAEGQHIEDAYPEFLDWVRDLTVTSWYGTAWLDDGIGEDEIGFGDGSLETPNVAQSKRR